MGWKCSTDKNQTWLFKRWHLMLFLLFKRRLFLWTIIGRKNGFSQKRKWPASLKLRWSLSYLSASFREFIFQTDFSMKLEKNYTLLFWRYFVYNPLSYLEYGSLNLMVTSEQPCIGLHCQSAACSEVTFSQLRWKNGTPDDKWVYTTQLLSRMKPYASLYPFFPYNKILF